jgi:hypothetical protein
VLVIHALQAPNDHDERCGIISVHGVLALEHSKGSSSSNNSCNDDIQCYKCNNKQGLGSKFALTIFNIVVLWIINMYICNIVVQRPLGRIVE